MLEAVGAEYFATFFEACDAALVPGGRMSLQSITFPDAAYERQLRGANWIQTYIFPGGLCRRWPPSSARPATRSC